MTIFKKNSASCRSLQVRMVRHPDG